jgi:nucleoside-diphosphate-sugar epimerase
MSVLVAGGRGFIGSNLSRLLTERDINHSIVDLKDGFDVCNVDARQFDFIVLLAADLTHTKKGYLHNLRIYEWASKFSAHIIYTSSAAVYGDSEEAHVEDEPTPAPTIYGKSKLLGETIIKDLSDRYTIFRLGNVYGNGDGNGAIDIFKRGGNKIFGDGEDVRDYIAVEKVCHAIEMALQFPHLYNKQTYNLSSFQPTTTYKAFCDYGSGEPDYQPDRGFDVHYSVLNNSKAREAGLL